MRYTILIPLAVCLLISTDALQAQSRAEEILKALDKDKNGSLQKSELQGRLKSSFVLIDTNGDGKLNLAELERLVKQLGLSLNRSGQSAVNPVELQGITLEENIHYRPGKTDAWTLDLFYPSADPTQKSESRPAVIFIHGGGWISGDKSRRQWRQLPLSYAKKGYVCISVNYRFLSEAPFPACIEDCKNAVRWLRAHAVKYQIDPNRIGAYGDSAGGHLVAMLGLTDRSDGLEGDGPYQEFSSAVNCVVCSAPPTNFMNWDGQTPFSPDLGSRLFRDLEPDEMRKMAAKCSPITYCNPRTPFLVMHGSVDTTVPVYQGDSFVEALKKSKAKVDYLRIDGAGHGVFLQAVKQTVPTMEKFFEQHLRTPPAPKE